MLLPPRALPCPHRGEGYRVQGNSYGWLKENKDHPGSNIPRRATAAKRLLGTLQTQEEMGHHGANG